MRLRRSHIWLILVAHLGLAGGFAVWRQLQPLPVVTLEPAFTVIGATKRTVTLRFRPSAEALESIEVRVSQNGISRTVPTEDRSVPGTPRAALPLVLDPTELGLQEGMAELQVLAREARWRPRRVVGPWLTHKFAVDLSPPTVELRTATGYVAHGGAGVVVYRVIGAVRSRVQVGGASFPGVSGLSQDPAIHVALFTIPYHGPPVAPSVVADDDAGNQRVIGLPVTVLPARFPRDTIRLTEAFLRRKLPELAPQTPGTASAEELLDAFLRVNREGRKANEATVQETTQAGSMTKPAWHGVFAQQPNTKVFANYPEERTYLVDDRPVDTQWHLGVDLASRRQSPVQAANAGRVAFTGPNGIFGHMVVVDHGLELFTLYAHLSEISVKPGQSVAKGEALGRSGETGLAGGDHLHFGVLVHGVYTSPLEWWDERWIHDRIARPLTEAGITLSGITDGPLTPLAAPSPRRARRGR